VTKILFSRKIIDARLEKKHANQDSVLALLLKDSASEDINTQEIDNHGFDVNKALSLRGQYFTEYDNGDQVFSSEEVLDNDDFIDQSINAIPVEHLDWVTETAKLCYAAEHAYCIAIREESEVWSKLTEKEQQHIIGRVAFCILYPDSPPSAFHDNWMIKKTVDGWKFGKVFDATKKLHPSIKPFHHLPIEQQAKDHIFTSIVHQTSVVKH